MPLPFSPVARRTVRLRSGRTGDGFADLGGGAGRGRRAARGAGRRARGRRRRRAGRAEGHICVIDVILDLEGLRSEAI